MQALILAAGYGTRSYPLTQTVAKPLLPLAGRPMLDYLLDRIREVDEVESVDVVTNHKFAASFLEWGESRDVRVHDDGTTSEEDRLGAIGDIQFVVDRAGLATKTSRGRRGQPVRTTRAPCDICSLGGLGR